MEENGERLRLHLRRRVSDETGSSQAQTVSAALPAPETALLICDIWDRHWCESARRRGDALAGKMAPVIEAARARGVHIIHAPSGCLDFYRDSPARGRMAEAPPCDLPRVPPRPVLALPIDDSDGGCDCPIPCETAAVWTRQHPALPIADADSISENGGEVYRFLRHHGKTTLFLAGVHANMCILGRSFGIRQMTAWGISCVLVRDLTDALYNPRRPPFVSHRQGTRLVVEHIETHWCPSILSADLRPPQAPRREETAKAGIPLGRR